MRYINKLKIRVVILILVFLGGGLLVLKKASSLAETSWETSTIKLVSNAQNADGGFGDIDLYGQPTLYDSYYFIKIRQLLGVSDDVNHERATEIWVKRYYKNMKGYFLQSENKLVDTYYSVKLLKILNSKIQNVQEIANFVLTHQNYDGGFSSNGISSDIVSTSFAIGILSDLNASFDRGRITDWLLKQLIKKNNNLLDTASIYRMLVQLNYDIRQLPTFKRDYQQLQNEVNRMASNGINSYDLFLLNDILEINDYFKENIIDIDDNVFAEILKHQNKDGGFSGVLNQNSDSKGTYLALRILISSGRQLANKNDLLILLDNHKSLGGGYSPIISSPSTFSTTALAIQILKNLKAENISEMQIIKICRSFIDNFNLRSINDPSVDDLYYAIVILNKLNQPIPKKPELIKTVSVELNQVISIDQKNIYLIKRKIDILKNLNCKISKKTEKALSQQVVDFLDVQKDNKDIYQKFIFYITGIDILNSLNSIDNLNSNEPMKFFNGLLKDDGGYSLEKSSDIYTTYHVLKTISYLKQKPKNLDLTKKWLMSYRLPQGGYKMKQKDTSVNLLATFLGLETEKLISNF